MLKFKRLPFVEKLETMENRNDAIEIRVRVSEEWLGHPGAQLLAHMLQEMQLTALDMVSKGVRPEFMCGRLSAIADIRRSLSSLLPRDSDSGELLEQGAEEEYFPEHKSGFDMPLAKGVNAEP